ncbi:MAG: hypothetical protein A3F84_25795 [Candidatus Handelsmanbacteria bacterium RIFCSPLOWO2_12_FULL_64_10]|uniref:Uncharacterized protein n=1 Tax=Handelsmanbacteria sp. (strain RIFCSPLOWO2_12_FULL_64_10) TaxID=1817868 RepID=A0A1F6C393_HANXR|nr:MAG: hypothetical protein A3F84_25795 [Candidatus Handelsmanbacteria bacterium RIFCSPLOWO2_12_FULL_64_10]
MAYKKDKSDDNKISPEFAARLDRLEPQQRVRAMILLRAEGPGKLAGQRQSRAERRAAVEAMRKSAEQALIEIDGILEHFGGQRQAERPDVLGTISVETTPAGIQAIAASKSVKAVLEDQAIYQIL